MEQQALPTEYRKALFAINSLEPTAPQKIEDCSDIIEAIRYIIKNPEGKVTQNLEMQLKKASKVAELGTQFEYARVFFSKTYLATQRDQKIYSDHNQQALDLMMKLELISEQKRSTSVPLGQPTSSSSHPSHRSQLSAPAFVHESGEKLTRSSESQVATRSSAVPTVSLTRTQSLRQDEHQTQLSSIRTIGELLQILSKKENKDKICEILKQLLLLDVQSAKTVVEFLSSGTFVPRSSQLGQSEINTYIDIARSIIKKQSYPFLTFAKFGSKITFIEAEFLKFKESEVAPSVSQSLLQPTVSQVDSASERQRVVAQQLLDEQTRIEEEKRKSEEEARRRQEETQRSAKQEEERKAEQQRKEKERQIEEQRLIEETRKRVDEERRLAEEQQEKKDKIQEQIDSLNSKQERYEDILKKLSLNDQKKQKLEEKLKELEGKLKQYKKEFAEFAQGDKFQKSELICDNHIQLLLEYIEIFKILSNLIQRTKTRIELNQQNQTELQQIENSIQFTEKDRIKLSELQSQIREIEEEVRVRKEHQLEQRRKEESEKEKRRLEEERKRAIEKQKLEEEKKKREEEKIQAEERRRTEEKKRQKTEVEEKPVSASPAPILAISSPTKGEEFESLAAHAPVASSSSIRQGHLPAITISGQPIPESIQPVEEYSQCYTSFLQKCELYSKHKRELAEGRTSTISKIRLETQIREIKSFFNSPDFERDLKGISKEERELIQEKLSKLEILDGRRTLRK